MRIGQIIKKTYAEGPGCRFCIWVQGCPHYCEGCFATELWDYSRGREYTLEDIISQFKSVSKEVCGITFLGGEPFAQAGELFEIAKTAHQFEKNVITFTGYTYEEIFKSGNTDYLNLLSETDLLIDGKFDRELLDYSRPLVGSSNQRFIFLTDKIKKSDIDNYKNRFEIRTDKYGNIVFNGMGNIEKLQKYINDLKGD